MDANVFLNFLSEFSPLAHILASCWECFPLTKFKTNFYLLMCNVIIIAFKLKQNSHM